jgi:hypothetical protein
MFKLGIFIVHSWNVDVWLIERVFYKAYKLMVINYLVLSFSHGHDGWNVLAKVNNKLKHLALIRFVFFIVTLVMQVKIILANGGWFSKAEVEEVSRGYDNDQTNESLVKL